MRKYTLFLTIAAIIMALALTGCSQNINDGMVDFTMNLGDTSTTKSLLPGGTESTEGSLWTISSYRIELYRLTTEKETASTFETYYEKAGSNTWYTMKTSATPTYLKTMNTLSDTSFRIPAGIYDVVVVGITNDETPIVVASAVSMNQKITTNTSMALTLAPIAENQDFSVTFSKATGLDDWTLTLVETAKLGAIGSEGSAITKEDLVVSKTGLAPGSYILEVPYKFSQTGFTAITGTYYEQVYMQYGRDTGGKRTLNLNGNATFVFTDNAGVPISTGTLVINHQVNSSPEDLIASTTTKTGVASFQNTGKTITYYKSATYNDVLTINVGAAVTGRTYAWKVVAEDGSATTVSGDTSSQLTFTPSKKGLYEVILVIKDSAAYSSGELRFGIDAGGVLEDYPTT